MAREARTLEAQGTEVVLVQLTADDLAVMGANLMNRSRRLEVMERAMTTTARASFRAWPAARGRRAAGGAA